MKFTTTILPLAALSTAFIIPEDRVAQQLKLEKPSSFLDNVRDNVKDIWEHTEEKVREAIKDTENAFDTAVDSANRVSKDAARSIEDYSEMVRFETQEWLDSANSGFEWFDHPPPPPPPRDGPPPPHDGPKPPHGPPPHDGPPPPHDGPKPPHGPPPHDGPPPPHDGPKPPHGPPPHHGPPHHGRPHHGDHKPNQTIYQLIAGSKYTTKLAKLINEFPDIVDALNSTGVANYTVFAPTDNAFDKIPDHHKKPSKEIIKKVLSYHVSPDFYPAHRIFFSHTIPTTLNASELGGNPQRLRVGLGLKGLAVNFYSRIEAANIFATNGVIHAVDSLLIPPPEILKIIDILPGEFSTLQLALIKTGLGEELEKAKHKHGATFFAPSNFAFRKLGPRINAFLFSERGLKYLKALLKYHIVAGETLYSDAYYAHDSKKPKTEGHLHFDLPTLLEGKSLSVDIGSFGAFLSYRINGFSDVAILDGVARDGVIEVVSSVLIPPKSPGGKAVELSEDMDLGEFQQLLIPSHAQEL